MAKHENMRKTGFKGIRPFFDYSDEAMALSPFKNKKTEFIRFILDSGPHHFFNTITFGRNTSVNERCQFTNVLIRMMNKIIFGRDYKEKGTYIEGFAFIEDHKSYELADRFHIHILIKDNPRYHDFNLRQHRDIFRKAVSKVHNGRDKEVFNLDATDIQYVFFEPGAVGYDTKSITDKCTNRIKIIGIDGLSDSEFVSSKVW